MRTVLQAALFGTGLLSACGTVEERTTSTIMVDGRPYEVRTSTVARPDGTTFERSSVIVKNKPYTCLLDSPGDCEAAVQFARSDHGDDR